MFFNAMYFVTCGINLIFLVVFFSALSLNLSYVMSNINKLDLTDITIYSGLPLIVVTTGVKHYYT